MHGLRSVSLVALALIAATACGDDDGDDGGGGGGGSIADLCATVCEKGATLSCPNEPADCAGTCAMDIGEAGDCAAEGEAYLSCAASRPASDYECDTDGESALIESACANESVALFACALGGGGGAGNGGGDCPFTNDGECDEPDICPAGTDTADCS